jgi:enoyl-CoA hydratase/carnithine racemase
MAEGDYRIGLNEVEVGIPLPPVILRGIQRLVGPRSAERLAVSGELVSAPAALELGLVDELVPPENVVARALEWCRKMLALPPQAMASTRQAARADLAAIFDADLEPELNRVTAGWWSAETQATLRTLAERLGKKAS